MYPANHFYGQTFVLALYTGVRTPPPPVWGFLQHSWMRDLAYWDRERMRPWWPAIVFSERNRVLTETFERWAGAEVVAIGAPFLYLQRLLGVEGAPPAEAEGPPILYPFHYFGDEATIPFHERLAAFARESYGADVTVCLHWYDHANPEIVGAYTRLALRVICHGTHSSSTFLVAQFAAMLGHRRVISNRVSTALWHAASLGCHVEVAGPVFEVENVFMGDETAEQAIAEERERWPFLFDGGVAGARARDLARVELGWEHLRPPDELREILGWSSPAIARSRVVRPLWRSREWLAALTHSFRRSIS